MLGKPVKERYKFLHFLGLCKFCSSLCWSLAVFVVYRGLLKSNSRMLKKEFIHEYLPPALAQFLTRH